MMAVQQANKITLKGSAAIVSEFFYYGINNILYQRGIYPPEMFKQEKKYGLTTLVTTDDFLVKYFDSVLQKLTEWLELGVVNRLVVDIREIETNETIEKWQFEIQCSGVDKTDKTHKDIKVIQSEICAIIRQITATVTFLPLLETPCSFNLLFHTSKDLGVPTKWEKSDPCVISNSEEVKLRSLSTSVHKVDGSVSYKFSM